MHSLVRSVLSLYTLLSDNFEGGRAETETELLPVTSSDSRAAWAFATCAVLRVSGQLQLEILKQHVQFNKPSIRNHQTSPRVIVRTS